MVIECVVVFTAAHHLAAVPLRLYCTSLAVFYAAGKQTVYVQGHPDREKVMSRHTQLSPLSPLLSLFYLVMLVLRRCSVSLKLIIKLVIQMT